MKTSNKQTKTRRNFIKQTGFASAFMAIVPTLSYSIPTYIPNLFKNKFIIIKSINIDRITLFLLFNKKRFIPKNFIKY